MIPQSQAMAIFDAMYDAIREDTLCSTNFRTFYEWRGLTAGESLEADNSVPVDRMPALRLDPVSALRNQEDLGRQGQITMAIEAKIWSPGEDIRDLFNLGFLLHRPLMSQDNLKARYQPAGADGVDIVDLMIPDPFDVSLQDRYHRGRSVIETYFWLKAPEGAGG